MNVLCDYLKELLVNYVFASTVYIALHSDDPGPGGDLNEITGLNYERGIIYYTDWDFPVYGSGIVTTNVDVTFPIAGDNWGSVSWLTIKDSFTDGNSFYRGEFDVPKNISTGDPFRIPAGDLSVGFS